MKRYIPVAVPLLLAFGLSSCAAVGGAKDVVVGFVAEKGNDYCEVRDPSVRDEIVTRINVELAKEGAEWSFQGVKCNADQAE